MFNKKQYLRFRFWVLFCLVLSGIPIIFRDNQVQAQIVPDKTLVNENSVVTPISSQRDRIDGGAIRGSNLFHSFTEFNIGEGREAYFSNPAAIANIFSRVTGNNPSQILGKLGVLGDANLFLLNPNGIIFGDGASLDIKGSFFATTASSFNFGSGKSYSAINPVAPPLLTVDVTPPIGLEFAGVAGDIENRGNLVVGKDLTLEGNNLNLQGRLQAGKDLTLKAENTVKVRDSQEKAFIAVGGDKLLIQGKENVDILALNNPNSGLFSGGDMFLKSARAVVGDIDFLSGGSFRVEKLDDSLGILSSPNGSIIRAGNDVSFDSYTGASLHIFAGGSVNVPGEIRITDRAKNSIREQVTLSDGETVVDIGGNSQPTLDIRAGIVGSGDDFATVPITNDSGASADININSISNATGTVFLTNQYQPNSALSGGISVDGIDTSSDFGGGDIFLDSKREITLSGNINASGGNIFGSNLSKLSGDGGNINLLARGDIFLSSETYVSSFGLLGGKINLQSNADISATKTMIQSITVTPVRGIKGGNVLINANSLNLNEGSIVIASTIGGGNAGDLIVNASTVKLTGRLDDNPYPSALASQSNQGASGNGGNIIIEAKHLLTQNWGFISASTFGTGNAGNLKVKANLVELIGSPVNGRLNSGGLFVTVGREETIGLNGNLTVETERLVLKDGAQISTSTFGKTKAGTLNITAKEIEIIGKQANRDSPSAILAQVEEGATGDGGNLTIQTNRLLIKDGGQISAGVLGSGNGGDLTVIASDIELIGTSSDCKKCPTGFFPSGLFVQVNPGAIGSGGNLLIQTKNLTIADGAVASTGTFSSGNAGNLTVKAESVNLIGNPANVEATTGLLTLVDSGATGSGGKLKINTESLKIADKAVVSAGTFGNGNAGSIEVTANTFEATNGGRILTTTSGKSKAGNINLNIKDNLTLIGSETGIFANATRNSTGNSGSIIIDPEVVNIFDGAQIAVDSQGTGIGGDIELTAGKLNLDNGTISAQTRSNTGGNITLNIQDLLLLRNRSEISTTAGEEQFGGNGGNIEINTPDGFIVAFPKENSDITANAFSGNGGNVDITAFGIFGIEFREQTTSLSDITASSQQALDGNVNIETPGIEPNPETVELPEDAQSTQLAQGCQASGEAAVAFFNIGRGGLPSAPGDTLNSEDVIAAWIPLVMEESQVDKKVSTVARSVKGKNGTLALHKCGMNLDF